MTSSEPEKEHTFLTPTVSPKAILSRVLSYGAIILTPFLIAWLVSSFLIGNYNIPSASMEKTLMVGDRIFATIPGAQEAKQGDIVVFKDVNNWLNSSAGEEGYLVKRVAAVGGDTISCCDVEGRVLINGQPYDEPWLVGENINFDEQVVPEGSVFLLGDNRGNSADSRYHIDEDKQFIPTSAIQGKAWLRYWPSWGSIQ